MLEFDFDGIFFLQPALPSGYNNLGSTNSYGGQQTQAPYAPPQPPPQTSYGGQGGQGDYGNYGTGTLLYLKRS